MVPSDYRSRCLFGDLGTTTSLGSLSMHPVAETTTQSNVIQPQPSFQESFIPSLSETDPPFVHKQAYRVHRPTEPLTSVGVRTSEHSSPTHRTTPSPQISYKPRHTFSRHTTSPNSVSYRQQFGAVARLALDGGLSSDQLLHIGSPTSTQQAASHPSQASASAPVTSSSKFMTHAVGVGRSPLHIAAIAHTHCLSRPVYQPAPQCLTYQAIHLTRPAPPDGFRTEQLRHRGQVPSAAWHQPTRCGSFPLQMTRVGGLVLKSPTFSTSTAPECSPTTGRHVPYQSVSACTSPSSGKHVPSTDSPELGTFFTTDTSGSSSIITPPVTFSSKLNSGTDIVRLGPGNTVTHVLANETNFDPTSLIRMHDCPQPYVGMDQSDEVHSAEVPPNTGLMRQNSPGSQEADIGQPSFLLSKLINRPSHASDVPCAVKPGNSNVRLAPLPNLCPQSFTRSSGFCSSPHQQVARTVRHLRRIRHIFGDSLGYSSSVSSASAGALATCERGQSVTTNSLVDLRTHEIRSADSVRPASYTCRCAPESSHLDFCCRLFNSTPVFEGLARFRRSFENSSGWTPWTRYHFRLTDGTIILTRCIFEGASDEVSTFYPVAHMHIPITDDTVTWHTLDAFTDCQLSLPAWAKADAKQYFIALCTWGPSVDPFTECQLWMDQSTACRLVELLGWTPVNWKKPLATSAEISPCNEVRQVCSKVQSSGGRSSSLGVAGPPGAVPLLRAASTAAASIGMPMVGRNQLTTLLHTTSTYKGTEVSPLIDSSHDPANGGVQRMKENSPESLSAFPEADTVRRPHRPNRGRVHQALNRIRRVAAASNDAVARSANATSSAARRFASSHGIVSHSKMGAGNASNIESSHMEQAISTAEPDALSLPNLLNSTCILSSHSPAILASSVSPTPALQTPCMTYLASGTNGAAHAPLSSTCQHSFDPSVTPHDTSVSFVGSSETTTDDYQSDSVGLQFSPSSTDLKPVSASKASSFIPLPLPSSGPLALHKCPRSTVSPFVPFVVELCITLVERYGVDCVGLYRLSGSKVAHDFISSELRKAVTEIDVRSDKWNDIHAVCGVLKTFLRSLPDSLFPKVMYSDFLGACRMLQREKRLLSIQRLLGIMECYPNHPEYRAHRATLRYLATHLARVNAREVVNKMTAYNLALVFAPNLVQPCEDSPELLMSDSKYKIMLVETVIKYHSWIFSPDLGLESGCSVPTDSVEDLASPVPSTHTELDVSTRIPVDSSPPVVPVNSVEVEDSVSQPEHFESDLRALVVELFNAAADLPPPPSDTDLETAEEPGPSSDRPSDIAMPVQRPRFTSIPSSAWSAAALRVFDSGSRMENFKFRPELILTQEYEVDPISRRDSEYSTDSGQLLSNASRIRPFTSQLGSKLDNLRHLSQGCLDQYTTEARQLGARVAESRRQLESTVAQRLHAEQLLSEARASDVHHRSSSVLLSALPSSLIVGVPDPSTCAVPPIQTSATDRMSIHVDGSKSEKPSSNPL